MPQLRAFFILALSVVRFCVHGRAITKPGSPAVILISQTTPNLGDMVCITPMFREIKRKYPHSRLLLMSRGGSARILKGNPYIDEYIDNTGPFLELLKILRKKKIDFAAATNPSTLGIGILYLAGIPCISTFTISTSQKLHSRLYHILKRFVIQIPLRVGMYVPAQYLHLLSPLGITSDDSQLELFISEEVEERISTMFASKNIHPDNDYIVAMAPGGSTASRWWASDRYAALSDYLYETYRAKIFFVGAGTDRQPIEEVLGHLDSRTQYENLLDQPLEEFKAFISKAGLVIGNDSGPMTIAKAFGRPQVVFIGPTDERAYHLPSGPLNRIVISKTRGSAIVDSANWTSFDWAEARRQMDGILLTDAIEQVRIVTEAIGWHPLAPSS